MKKCRTIATVLIVSLCLVGLYFTSPAIAEYRIPDYVEKSPRVSIGSIKVVDLTHSIQNGIPLYFATFEGYENIVTWEAGYYINRLVMTEHTGTHLDAPAHFVEGQWFVDEIPIDRLSGICVTIDMKNVIVRSKNPNYMVTKEDIMAWERKTGTEIKSGYIVFMHTGWDEYWNSYVKGKSTKYGDNWPGLDESAAEYLCDKGIKGFGLDTLSLDPAPSTTFPTHVTLYSENIWGLENLDNLGEISTISYVFVAPMKIKEGSGGPARVWAVFDRSDPVGFAEEMDEIMSALYDADAAYDLAQTIENGIPIYFARWWGFTNLVTWPAGYYINQLDMTEHTGTHLDAPAHFVKRKWYVDEIPLDRLFGSAVVMDMSEVVEASGNPNYAVTADDIIAWEEATGIKIQRGDIVFMYTGWDEKWDDALEGTDFTYIEEWPAIDQTAAKYLRDKGIKGFGLDTLSLDPAPSTTFSAHFTLYRANIWGVENVHNLSYLVDSRCYVIVMPWMLWHGSGGPCRIIAFSLE